MIQQTGPEDFWWGIHDDGPRPEFEEDWGWEDDYESYEEGSDE